MYGSTGKYILNRRDVVFFVLLERFESALSKGVKKAYSKKKKQIKNEIRTYLVRATIRSFCY